MLIVSYYHSRTRIKNVHGLKSFGEGIILKVFILVTTQPQYLVQRIGGMIGFRIGVLQCL